MDMDFNPFFQVITVYLYQQQSIEKCSGTSAEARGQMQQQLYFHNQASHRTFILDCKFVNSTP
jgi:hypothetical protein